MALLDLVLDYDCNLHCNYCTITDAMRKKNIATTVVGRHIELAATRGYNELSITGGEPTIRKDLEALIRFARKRGFRDIKVQSNGLMFAYPSYLERMLKAGLTRLHISIHAHGKSAYTRVTGSGSESYDLLIQAIDQVVQSPIELCVDMIIMSETYETLPEALQFFHQLGVTHFNLWLVSLTDKNKDNPESLPKITDTLSSVKACMDYGHQHGLKVHSLHIPRCLLAGYEDHVYHPGFRDVLVITPESQFQLNESLLSGQTKTDRCEDCRFYTECPGLRDDYIARYGDRELQAVPGSKAPGPPLSPLDTPPVSAENAPIRQTQFSENRQET